MTFQETQRRPDGATIDKSCVDDTRLPGPAPSTDPDGLDLTLEEARAMSPEEFRQVFGVEGLDGLPRVGPGLLEKAPRGCQLYLRLRRASRTPGGRGARTDSIELVVRTAQYALPAAGIGMVVRPSCIGLATTDWDEAALKALIMLARKQGRRRRASTWPIERIQSLLCAKVLDTYVDVFLAGPRPLDAAGRPKRSIDNTIYSIRAFQKAFPDLQVGDFGNWINKGYAQRTPDRSPHTRRGDLYAVWKGLKEGLAHLGVPRGLAPGLRIEDPGRLPKVAWTPGVLDRLRAAADRYPWEADGTPRPIVLADGFVYPHSMAVRSWKHREYWRRAIELLPYTGTRVGRLPLTRWVGPEVEPMDGLPLPRADRPWIEVQDDAIWFHRDGESRVDSNKRRGPVQIAKELEPVVRRWFEEDAAKGFEFVFHKPDGSRHYHRQFSWETFKNIVRDAGVNPEMSPHWFKDLFVELCDSAGMPREEAAAAADTSTRTLERKYGPALRKALLRRAAEGITQGPWRERASSKTAVADRFAAARARRLGGTS
ncbi:hypothetical protein [Bradyrhizobium diazoefficiens]|uniref:Uncharacterized protein n=1 Tax=Bradyrhizobium diazoefficiens TaxID=1355477 RepID=A0A809WRB2_9BRAD|nr:hypothetical protein XF1B_04980 [Bradyrhizobium diazoefficiens]BCF22545.1 hypothetical protein XF14B_04970 [Bradyrhizobium diazoefficiens]